MFDKQAEAADLEQKAEAAFVAHWGQYGEKWESKGIMLEAARLLFLVGFYAGGKDGAERLGRNIADSYKEMKEELPPWLQ